MNSTERAAYVIRQADFAEGRLQEGTCRHSDAGPSMKIAEDALIEGLSVDEYNDYMRARAALARKFAGKLN